MPNATTSASAAAPKSSAAAAAAAASAASAAARAMRAAVNLQDVKDMWYGVVSAFIGVLALVRVLDLLVAQIRKGQVVTSKHAADEKREIEAPTPGTSGKVSLRRIPQALLTAFRIFAFRWTLPIGTQSVIVMGDVTVIIGYFVGMLVWNFTHTSNLNVKFYDDRAGNLASSQIPFVVALAGKNNIIAFLTGISHEKLNVLHRASARSLLVLLWVHAWGRWKAGLTGYTALDQDWMKCGVAGLVALSLAAIFSLRPIRQRFFEFFLVGHILLILIFIIGGYYHRPECQHFFWPGLLVWGLDRVLRIGRVLTNNCRWWRKTDKCTTATVELVSASTIRLTMRRPMTWKAGQHAFVILPSVSTLPFEAHPFTISSICGAVDGGDSRGENDLVFLIRGHGGFTRRLQDHAARTGQGQVAAVVDGPYGIPPDLTTFSTCILIAGGSGITYTLPLLLDAVRNVRLGKSACRRILFVWAIRDRAHLKWISAALISALTAAPSHLVIEPRVYLTRATGTLPALSYSEEDVTASQTGSDEDKKKASDTLLSVLRTEVGRPDVRALLKAEVEASSDRVSVDVAGPGPLAKAVRSTLRGGVAGPLSVLKGSPTVSLHVETFGNVGQ